MLSCYKSRLLKRDYMDSSIVNDARMMAETHLRAQAVTIARTRAVASIAGYVSQFYTPIVGTCLVAAAWLCEIGSSSLVRDTTFICIDGAYFARRAGFDELVVSLVAHRAVAAIDASCRGGSLMLRSFAQPPQHLLRSLNYCDLTVSSIGTRITVGRRFDELLNQHCSESQTYKALQKARIGLIEDVIETTSWLRRTASI